MTQSIFFNRFYMILTLLFLHFALKGQYFETDILIIGGGPSGTAAGIQAARMGAKVIIIEENLWLGGSMSVAGATAMEGNDELLSGIWAEFRENLKQEYGGIKALGTGTASNILFEPHVAANIFKNMTQAERNLKVLIETKVTSLKKVKPNRDIIPNFEGGWLVLCKDNKGKTQRIQTRILIDATDLGDILKMAGVKYRTGTDEPNTTGETPYYSQATNQIQDITYIAILKDQGGEAPLIPKPDNYDPSVYDCACRERCDKSDLKGVVKCDIMVNFAKLPNNKYMLNWPTKGNHYAANMIEADEKVRQKLKEEAKQYTLGFAYYIQNELGYKYIGLADDEYPTEDKMPFTVYHREGRRTEGVATFTLGHIVEPYNQADPLFRTGIAVGNAPLRLYHAANKTETLEFNTPHTPAFTVPMSALIPKDMDDFLVAEKNISVSHMANGATNAQPCTMLIGQAVGVLATKCVLENKQPKDIGIREVQTILMDNKAFLMPYTDVKREHPYFKLIQRIGAADILRGRIVATEKVHHLNFNPDSVALKADIEHLFPMQMHDAALPIPSDSNIFSTMGEVVTLSDAMKILYLYETDIIKTNAWRQKADMEKYIEQVWKSHKLGHFDPQSPIKRLELAILFDALFDPFNKMEIDIKGHYKAYSK